MMMKHQGKLRVFLPNFIILVTILLHSTTWTSSAQEVGKRNKSKSQFGYKIRRYRKMFYIFNRGIFRKDESEFDYIKGSEKGPSHWGGLKKEWETCKSGKMQSPIDLSSHRVRVVPKLGKLKKHYKPQNATVKNRGHDIELKWEGDAGSININGTEFFLHQCHWHSPSEHTINGRRYDLELHMVHESKSTNGKGKIAVVGLFYKIGRPDSVLKKLSKLIKSMVDEEKEKKFGVFDPSTIKLGGKKYYRYMGSLTVPPCTQGVIWTINKKIRTVSREQVELLREVVHDHAKKNSRPIQPLNKRGIQLYGRKKKE